MILQRFLIYANIGLFTVILAKEQGTTVDFTKLYREEGDLITILNDWIWLASEWAYESATPFEHYFVHPFQIHIKKNIPIGKEDPKLAVKIASLELTLNKIKKGRRIYKTSFCDRVTLSNFEGFQIPER